MRLFFSALYASRTGRLSNAKQGVHRKDLIEGEHPENSMFDVSTLLLLSRERSAEKRLHPREISTLFAVVGSSLSANSQPYRQWSRFGGWRRTKARVAAYTMGYVRRRTTTLFGNSQDISAHEETRVFRHDTILKAPPVAGDSSGGIDCCLSLLDGGQFTLLEL